MHGIEDWRGRIRPIGFRNTVPGDEQCHEIARYQEGDSGWVGSNRRCGTAVNLSRDRRRPDHLSRNPSATDHSLNTPHRIDGLQTS